MTPSAPDACSRDEHAPPTNDARAVKIAVDHWGFPSSNTVSVRWEPLRRASEAVAGSTCTIWRALVDSASDSVSMVVKTLHFAESRSQVWAASGSPSDPMYWRREAEALRYFRASALPGPLDPGRCRLVVDLDDGHTELWLDDQTGECGAGWDTARLAVAARHLGETQGAIVADGVKPEPWWSRGWLRAYLGRRIVDPAVLDGSPLWDLPSIRAHFDPEVGRSQASIWARRFDLLRQMDRIQPTLCHLDFWPPNLFGPADGSRGRTIAIDWGFAGWGALGEDIANLVPDCIVDEFVESSSAPELAEAVFESYVDGLRSAGCRTDASEVRFAYGTAMSLKYTWMTQYMLDTAAAALREPAAFDLAQLDTALRARGDAARLLAAFGTEAIAQLDGGGLGA